MPLKNLVLFILFSFPFYGFGQNITTCSEFKNVEVIDLLLDKSIKIIFKEDEHIEYLSDDELFFVKSKIIRNPSDPCKMTLEIVEINEPNFPFQLGKRLDIKLLKFTDNKVSYKLKVNNLIGEGLFEIKKSLSNNTH